MGLKVSSARKQNVLLNLIPPLPVMCLMAKAGMAIDFLCGKMCPSLWDGKSGRVGQSKIACQGPETQGVGLGQTHVTVTLFLLHPPFWQ